MTPYQREVMQMAIDGLEGINQCSLPPTGIPLPAEIDEAKDALRAAIAQPEQGPQGGYRWREGDVPPSMTYTAPPQREWKGLTDEERQECLYSDPIFGMAASTFAHAIEAKLREKNFDRPS